MDDLKALKKRTGVFWWEVADHIGVSEMTIYRWLRKYDPEHHAKILNAINELEEGEVNAENS